MFDDFFEELCPKTSVERDGNPLGWSRLPSTPTNCHSSATRASRPNTGKGVLTIASAWLKNSIFAFSISQIRRGHAPITYGAGIYNVVYRTKQL